MFRFWEIFWIDATSKETIGLSLQGIASHPDAQAAAIKPSTASVLQWLSRIKHDWLLIFDGADGTPGMIPQFLPQGNHGSILFTSRNPDMQRNVPPQACLEVQQMGEEEAISLLLKAAFLDVSSGDLRQASKPIVEELCCLPLAIDQAGAAIGNHICDIHSYLKLYSKHHKEFMAHSSFRGASMYGHAVYGTW